MDSMNTGVNGVPERRKKPERRKSSMGFNFWLLNGVSIEKRKIVRRETDRQIPGVMEAGNKGAYAGKSLSIGLNINLPLEQTANEYQDISIDFKHFFARKVMFVRYASAYVVMPGGYGTLDELMEILTLIQTGKSRPIPIVMVGRKFWKGLIDWFKNSLITEGTIDGPDLDLLRVVDTPDEVVTAIFDHYGKRSFDPSPEEQRLMMDL